MRDGWRRVTKSSPCPVCKRPNGQHTATWCITTIDNEVIICPFTPDGAEKYIEDSGYLHRLNGNTKRRFDRPYVHKNAKPIHRRVVNWVGLQEFYRHRINNCNLVGLSLDIDVSTVSLHALRVGYEGNDTWTFPMCDHTGKIIGIRKRNCKGKTAIYGSRNGLFMTAKRVSPGVVVVCEGPTDTAKAIDMGYCAIGRASCNTCEAMVERFLNGRPAVIMADNDDTGIHYANRLAKRIGAKVVLPARGKDLREWNPTREEFVKAIRIVTR